MLLARPQVLLLDEPDAALDDASAEAVRATVARFAADGGAVVRVRHRGDDGLASRRLLLADGGLIEVAPMSGAEGAAFADRLAAAPACDRSFVVFVGIVSLRLSLGITKDLAIATVRTYVQLIALGFVLRWVFDVNSPWLVLAIVVLMVLAAAQIILRRSPDAPRGIFASSALAMALTGFTVTFAVTGGLVIQVDPWYWPRYVIPLAGMVLGNSMTGIALALERLFADLDLRSDEILRAHSSRSDAEGGRGFLDTRLAEGGTHPHDQFDGGGRHRLHPRHD